MLWKIVIMLKSKLLMDFEKAIETAHDTNVTWYTTKIKLCTKVNTSHCQVV